MTGRWELRCKREGGVVAGVGCAHPVGGGVLVPVHLRSIPGGGEIILFVCLFVCLWW